MKQEITIVIKSEDGELLDMRELVSTYLHSDEGMGLVRVSRSTVFFWLV